jgi:hypothetical protein
MPNGPQHVRRRTAWLALRATFVTALTALSVCLATPGTLLAKWTLVVEVERTTATAGEPAQLAAVIEVLGHDVPGDDMPSSADLEDVRFRLWRSADGEPIVVPATKDGPLDGRYVASVTFPEAGEWRVAVVFRLDGQTITHDSLPDQEPFMLAVDRPLPDTAMEESGTRVAAVLIALTLAVVIGATRPGRLWN